MPNLFNVEDQEEWRDVVGFEGLYQVSNLGRVKSCERVTSNGRPINEHLLKGTGTGTDYRSVSLWKNNYWNNKLIHRLVAEAFLPNPDNLPEVNHKDSNPKNNRLDNLEWVSSKENTSHRIANKDNEFKYRKSVLCLESGEIFTSLTAAGRSVAASTQQVIDSINSHSCCKGMTFVYSDQMPENIEEYVSQAHAKYQNFHRRPKMPNSKKVRIKETGEVFDSMSLAARHFNCDTTTISNRVKAGKPFNGLTFEFVT